MESEKFGADLEGDDYDAALASAIAVDLDCRFCAWDGSDSGTRPIIVLCNDENGLPHAFCPKCMYELASSHDYRGE